MNRIISLLILFLAASFSSFAQDEMDALRYSYLAPQGTARSIGFGSALGSIGGDFTSLSINPAGIGIYRSSEINFTPSIRFNSTSSEYLNNDREDNNTRFNIGSVGFVFTRAEKGKRYDRSSWKAVSFGIGVNRLADFNRNYSYRGLMQGSGNNFSSFSELFVADANQNPSNATSNETSLAYLGYQSYLIDQDTGGFFTLANWETGLEQLRNVEERGGMNELVLSVGGNYEEKLMVGATIGFPSVRYTRESYFQETDISGDANNDFDNFRYSESLKTTGLGVNLKLGMIFKPTDNFRFGLAVHTPTWFQLEDEYNAGIVANTENYKASIGVMDGPTTAVQAPTGSFEYNLTTPWRGIVSASVLFGKYGFISADYEYVDYASARYRFPDDFSDLDEPRNEAIKNNFKAASNFRLGLEGRMDNFFVRAGFGFYGSPYEDADSKTNRLDFSGGVGYRMERFFVDLGFVHSSFDIPEKPYTLPAPVVTPVAQISNNLNNLALTFGVKL